MYSKITAAEGVFRSLYFIVSNCIVIVAYAIALNLKHTYLRDKYQYGKHDIEIGQFLTNEIKKW